MNTPLIRRTAALTVSAALLLGALPVSAVGDGVKPTYDEAYYATTDYYGNLTEGSVVKSYATNGAVSLTDYGDYDEIVNLTDGTAPSTADGAHVFTFDRDRVPDHFYFEGKTEKPFEQLPWTLSVHYALNGVAARAEDLAGKTGVVEITVDAIPNESASEYARNNYTLEAMAIFNQDDILSLEAPGAQVQLIGNLRAVLFVGLPGEECHFFIRVGSERFAFDGLTLLMVPATLSQLEEIAKLSTRKDDLEENYEKLSDSLDVLLDSMNGISSSLYDTAKGLDELNEARDTISNGTDDLHEKADLARSDLDALNEALSTLPGHLDESSKLVDDTNQSLGEVNDSLKDVQDQMKDVQDQVDALCDQLEDLRKTGNVTADDLTALGKQIDKLKESLGTLLDTLVELNIQIGGEDITVQGMNAAQLSAQLKAAQTLEDLYLAAKNGQMDQKTFLASMLLLSGAAADQADAAAKAESMMTLVSTVDAAVARAMESGLTQEQALQAVFQTEALQGQQDTYEQAKKLEALYTGIRGGTVTEEAFFIAAQQMQSGTITPEQAKKNWELFQKSKNLTSNVEALCDLLGSKGLAEHTAKLLRETGAAITRLNALAREANLLIDRLDDALDAADELYDVLDENVPELKQTLTDTKTTITALSRTLTDTNAFLGAFQALLKTSGTQLDSGTKQTLEGLAASLRATARSLDSTGNVKSAKNNINGIIEDTWEEYTGGINNLLLMDATAEAQSLTDERNGAPQSIQILIRTQEIQQDSGSAAELEAQQAKQTTFWGRVAQMFRDLWSAVTGIFGGKD